MSTPPVIMRYEGDGIFKAVAPVMVARCEAAYERGQMYRNEFREDRSGPSHRQYFAMINEFYNQLPEDIASNFQGPDELRAFALIKKGFADHVDVTLGDESLAQRIARLLIRLRKRYFKHYAVIIPKGTVVRIYTAQSQSYKAMDRKRFQASKEATLGFLSDLTGIDHKTLGARAAEAPDDAHGHNAPDIPEHPQTESHRQTAPSQDAPPAAVSGASTANAITPELPVTGGASPEGKTGGGGELMPRNYRELLDYVKTWTGYVKGRRFAERVEREKRVLWPTMEPPLTAGQIAHLDGLIQDRAARQ